MTFHETKILLKKHNIIIKSCRRTQAIMVNWQDNVAHSINLSEDFGANWLVFVLTALVWLKYWLIADWEGRIQLEQLVGSKKKNTKWPKQQRTDKNESVSSLSFWLALEKSHFFFITVCIDSLRRFKSQPGKVKFKYFQSCKQRKTRSKKKIWSHFDDIRANNNVISDIFKRMPFFATSGSKILMKLIDFSVMSHLTSSYPVPRLL